MNLKNLKLFNLFVIILLLSGVELFAQKIDNRQPCGTPATSFEELQKKFYFGDNDTLYRLLARLPQIRQEVHGGAIPIADRVWRDDDPNIIWSVPVTFWAYTATAGGYPTAHQDAQEVIDELNRNFSKNRLPIRFYQYCDVNVIVNAHFANTGNDSDVSDMMSNHAINGSLNIHFVSPSMSFAGLHKTVWVPLEYSYAVFVTRTAIHDGSTSTHEVGHFFELDHTHNNYDADWMPQCRREPVDRNRTWPFFSLCLDKIFSSNRMCNSTGDALCDTPADPELNSGGMVDSDCNYFNQTRRDYWGDSYFNPPAGSSQPDTRNFMSYSYATQCLSRFSDGQRAVMINSIHSGRYKGYSAAWGSPVVRFDTYEPDHRPQTARRIAIEEKQLHTFHKASFGNFLTDCDVDYVYFDVPLWGRYTVFTSAETGKLHLQIYKFFYKKKLIF